MRLGVIRTVIIDDLDRNPCCGTHYHSLAPLQTIHVSPFTTPVRGTHTRVYFLAGPRVAHQLASSLNNLRATGSELSCGFEDIPNRVKILADNFKEISRREKRLRNELADFVAVKIVQQAKADNGSEGHLLGAIIREEDSTNDIEFLSSVQERVKSILAASDKQQSYAFALGQVGSTEVVPDGCLLVFTNDEMVMSKVASEMKAGETQLAKKVRGGGKGKWQGKITNGRFRKDTDEQLLLEMLKRALS